MAKPNSRFRITRPLILFVSALSLSACQPNNQQALLTTKQSSVTQSDLPIATQITLYESALTQYWQTHTAITQHLASQSPQQPPKVKTKTQVEWLIDKPIPPRVSTSQLLPLQPLWQETSGQQRHRIDWVCSYQSANCARLSQALSALLPHLDGGYTLRYFNQPQAFQKYSSLAAQGETCLTTKDQQQIYRDYLWQQSGNLTPKIIQTGLLQRGLSPQQADNCLGTEDLGKQQNEHLHAQQQNERHLQDSGLGRSPALWFNHIFVSQHHWGSELMATLKGHLQVQDQASKVLPSAVPAQFNIELSDLWQSSTAATGRYVIHNDPQPSQNVILNTDSLWPWSSEISWVYALSEHSIDLFQNGKIVRLALTAPATSVQESKEPAVTPESLAEGDNVNLTMEHAQLEAKVDSAIEDQPESEEANHQQRYERALADTPVQPLSAQWLDEQLLRQRDLEQALFPTEHEVEGHSLLKLSRDELDPFYQTLGLEPGDVIVRVNDQWIYEGNNPLWDLLQRESKVTVSVIRKGLPVHFAFARSDTP